MRDSPKLLQIWERLRSECTLAVEPDHPYLLTPPNALISKNGRLTAIFLISHDKLEYIEQLLVRLAISKLALPRHMHCVLITMLDSERAQNVWDIVRPHFHRIENYEDLAKSRSSLATTLLADWAVSSSNQDSQNYLAKMSHCAFARSHILLDEMLKQEERYTRRSPLYALKQLERSGNYKRVTERSWLDNGDHRAGILRHEQGFGVDAIQFRKDGGIAQLRSHCASAVRWEYMLDNGVPYQNSGAGLVQGIIVNRFPTFKGDPWKPARAAAFMGCALFMAKPHDELAQTLVHVNSQAQRPENSRRRR